jgi:hypothetical protein
LGHETHPKPRSSIPSAATWAGPGRAGPTRARRTLGLDLSGQDSTKKGRVVPYQAKWVEVRPSTVLKHDRLPSGRAGPGTARHQ